MKERKKERKMERNIEKMWKGLEWNLRQKLNKLCFPSKILILITVDTLGPIYLSFFNENLFIFSKLGSGSTVVEHSIGNPDIKGSYLAFIQQKVPMLYKTFYICNHELECLSSVLASFCIL
jgi:hypothetical protein